MSSTLGIRKWLAAGAAGVSVTAGSVLAAAPVHAAAPVTVAGTIGCINSASPVGVWIEAESSTSGWATKKVPITLGGHSKVDYSFTLDKGGRYKVHVGCGGTPQDWGTVLKSTTWVSGTKNNFVCNDAHPLSIAAFKAIAGRIFGKADLTQGVPYKNCKPTKA